MAAVALWLSFFVLTGDLIHLYWNVGVSGVLGSMYDSLFFY
jgi:hypothetical protein